MYVDNMPFRAGTEIEVRPTSPGCAELPPIAIRLAGFDPRNPGTPAVVGEWLTVAQAKDLMRELAGVLAAVTQPESEPERYVPFHDYQ